jgi:hypothetical protein
MKTVALRVPSAAQTAEPLERITCEWCQGQNEKTALACWACGAPLDIRNLVSESGWREAPRIKDMTEIHFGTSTCQVEGEIVPVAELNLGPGDAVFFEHHVLLWKDDLTAMSVMPMQGGIKRALAGMPFSSASRTPGPYCFRDATGELVVLALHRAWNSTRERLPAGLATINYSYLRIRVAQHSVGGQGVYGSPVTGNRRDYFCCMGTGTFRAGAAARRKPDAQPGAFLYKDLRT